MRIQIWKYEEGDCDNNCVNLLIRLNLVGHSEVEVWRADLEQSKV